MTTRYQVRKSLRMDGGFWVVDLRPENGKRFLVIRFSRKLARALRLAKEMNDGWRPPKAERQVVSGHRSN